jgi:hypothetical protein
MNEMRIFTYEVSYYNSQDEIENCQGIIFAESYEDIMTKFNAYYGDRDITKLSVVERYNDSEDTLIELSKSTIQSLIDKGELSE